MTLSATTDENSTSMIQFFLANTTVIALVSLVALIAVVSLGLKAHTPQTAVATVLPDATASTLGENVVDEILGADEENTVGLSTASAGTPWKGTTPTTSYGVIKGGGK